MESIQSIKNRIQSISSTRQITQSMRLVSSSKVQKTRTRMQANLPFFEQARMLVEVAAGDVTDNSNIYLADRDTLPAAVIAISADRGLCGGYNANAMRFAAVHIKKLENTRIITVGAKARDFFRRRRNVTIAHSFHGISENPYFEDAGEITALALDWYKKGEIGRIDVVYTRFQSMLVQEPVVLRLLPLERRAGLKPVTLEPAGPDFLAGAVPFYLAASIYGALLESAVCEQSARVTSMDTATKNSNEMIDALTLRYNQARQGAITQEITEIVGGANAV